MTAAQEQLQVDWLRCDGHGLCAGIVPELVSLDDWGYPIVLGAVTASTRRAVRRAITLCPVLALRIERQQRRLRQA